MTSFLALVGPTACGKTALSLALAQRVDAEVISMDSRQVYRGMDIGTAKVTPAERGSIPHHGLDLVEPDQRYSAGQFARDARGWIAEIGARGRVPLVVGGTGFFLRALQEPIFSEPELDPIRVEALRRYLRDVDRGRLEAWVYLLDPERAPLAVEGGRQRMSRTLEVALLSGRPLSSWHRDAPREGEPVRGLVVALEIPKDELDRRIGIRVSKMVEAGFVEEVRTLLARGYHPESPGMTGTGYREVARHLAGEATLEEAMAEMARRTRQYARRQITWFRHQLPEETVRIDATAPLQEQVAFCLALWRDATKEEEG
ncbi:MAG TPA: tRNA (adenosine(37)-N6)-dimethylallyltransferase MiaA [Longimicrobiales bacterium]|nr:tRNA (adenosine(37)-N6)-dimethylallyltransferase MiaA [Longimicrobiales bacterium]